MSDRRYNTKEGIAEMITSLEGINELNSLRHEAGYERKERLKDFYILGRWFTDSCGNFGKIIQGSIPKEMFPDIPDVLTREELQELFEQRGKADVYFGISMNSYTPPVRIICTECGKQWTIEDCHDTVMNHTEETISLAEFVGKTLGETQDIFYAKKEASYRMQDDILIRNDRFIDLSPKYPEPENDYQKELVKNKFGWVSAKDGIDRNYIIQEGDEGYFNIWHYYHQNCQRQRLAREEESYLRDIFTRAEYEILSVEATKNTYCENDTCCPPWFLISTPIGTFEIGWRKRVINIDWCRIDTRIFPPPIIPSKLFKNEDVTKGRTFIHAWGPDKAVEYLSKIREFLAPVVV